MSGHPQRYLFGYTDRDIRILRGRLNREEMTTDFCFGPVMCEVPNSQPGEDAMPIRHSSGAMMSELVTYL